MRRVAAIALLLILTGCGQNPVPPDVTENVVTPGHTIAAETPEITETPLPVSEMPVTPPEPTVPPDDGDLVRILDHIPAIYIDLKYATADTFTGEFIYDFTDAYLRYGTVKKLADVQSELEKQGYCLKIWDAYRPVSTQFKLWEVYPDPAYVANPNTGYSSHSRGNTVDVTLVLADGTEVEMPTGFDDFTKLADRDYSDVSESAANNALVLETLMEANGFTGYYGEWWHFSDSVEYPVIEDDSTTSLCINQSTYDILTISSFGGAQCQRKR